MYNIQSDSVYAQRCHEVKCGVIVSFSGGRERSCERSLLFEGREGSCEHVSAAAAGGKGGSLTARGRAQLAAQRDAAVVSSSVTY